MLLCWVLLCMGLDAPCLMGVYVYVCVCVCRVGYASPSFCVASITTPSAAAAAAAAAASVAAVGCVGAVCAVCVCVGDSGDSAVRLEGIEVLEDCTRFCVAV
jgi:hypothetical protein